MKKHTDKVESGKSEAAHVAAIAPATGEESAPAPSSPAASPSPETEDFQALTARAAEHWERYVRLSADFENYKKRAARERQEAGKFANESLLQKLIPVIDNFEAALAAAGGSPLSLQAGITMIHQQLRNVLAETGLEEIDAAGKPFDPNFHEAVAQEATTDAPEGQVVKQLRKGYRLRERLLRPATVIVAKKPAIESAP